MVHVNFSFYIILGFCLALPVLTKFYKHSFYFIIIYWLILFASVLDRSMNFFSFKTLTWIPTLNINFSYQADGLAKLFMILISGIGILVFYYAKSYFETNLQKQKKLIALLQVFAVSMLGLTVTNNYIVLFIFWELTTVTSYLLIQFDYQSHTSNLAALSAIFIGVMGGLIMLVGFILLQDLTKTNTISQSIRVIINQPQQAKDILQISFLLILFGVITKSAQFPFHFWLPNAMKAPTPVSAYLHSATMVNAGIYLLARMYPAMHTLPLWYPLLASFGLITMLTSSIIALRKQDLKAILAYTTIFSLGSMVYLLASPAQLASEAFVILLFFHAIYKAGTFMLTGIIDKHHHTRDLLSLRGIANKKPLLILVIVILFGAMAGLPPLFGFAVKEMMIEAKLAPGNFSTLTFTISTMSSIFIAACSLHCIYVLISHNSSQRNFISAIKLTYPIVFCILIGLVSITTHWIEPYIYNATLAIQPQMTTAYVSPNNPTTILVSILTVVIGAFIAMIWYHYPKLAAYLKPPFTASEIFFNSLELTIKSGEFLTNITQNQTLDTQLRIVFITLCLMVTIALGNVSLGIVDLITESLKLPYVFLYAILIISSLYLIKFNELVKLTITLSVIGLALTTYFLYQGALDVAITQLLVDILAVIILLIALRKSYGTHKPVSKTLSWFNAIIALVFGSIIFIIFTNMPTTSKHLILTKYYVNNSYLVAHGKNVVNVILVDFRSIDTLGEILVVLCVALCIWLIHRKYFESKNVESTKDL